jgi:hypothetical protein
MHRLYRVGVLTLLALSAWLVAASSVGAAAVGAAIVAGPLSISPTTVNLTYTIPTGSKKHVVKSSFSVTVTDATGTAAGWMVRAASTTTLGPLGATPDVDHAIIDFDITQANGVPPNPTCICDTIPTALGEILRTPSETGVGRSTEKFITQLTVPAGATPGTYNATLALDVAPLGSVLPAPGGRATGPTTGGPAPKPMPSTRAAPAGSTVSGTPAPMPMSSRPVVAPASSANSTVSQPAASTSGTSDRIQAAVVPSVAPATTGSDLPTANNRVVDPATGPPATTTSDVQPSGAKTVSTTASAVNDTTPVQTVTAPSAATTDRATTSNVTEAIAPVVERDYPVATLVGNAVSFAPAMGDDGANRANINWHLQATYAPAGHSAIARAFGRNAPTRMNAGAVAIVVTQSGLGQATMTFTPQQADAAPAIIEPAVVTISIVAGP